MINLIIVLIVVLLVLLTSAARIVQQRQIEKNNGKGTNTEESAKSGDPLDTLFFVSDYQYENGWDQPSDTLTDVMDAVKADGKTIDMTVVCGDYSNIAGKYDYQIDPDESVKEIKDIFTSAYSDLEDEDMLFVQGNHDQMTSLLAESGLHEYDDYLVYVLNTEKDFPWSQGKTQGCLAKVTAASEEMKKCFDELISDGETRPVFIAGHVPLHFTARTSSKHHTGDNMYSSLIFNVVNDAAKSLDIIYLYGHNHSKGWDCYMGGSSVFKEKGDTILIPEYNEINISTDKYSAETLNFTYLNAGYTGYYMNCGPDDLNGNDGQPDKYDAADETLTGTTFEIYKDSIVITRYSADGVHELGHEGEANPYKNGIDKDLISSEYYGEETESPQELELHNAE